MSLLLHTMVITLRFMNSTFLFAFLVSFFYISWENNLLIILNAIRQETVELSCFQNGNSCPLMKVTIYLFQNKVGCKYLALKTVELSSSNVLLSNLSTAISTLPENSCITTSYQPASSSCLGFETFAVCFISLIEKYGRLTSSLYSPVSKSLL